MANFPTSLIISASDITSSDDIIISENLSGVRYTRSRNNQRWSFTLTFSLDKNPINWKSAMAEISQYNFGMNLTTIVHPLFTASQGNLGGNIIRADGLQNVGATTINVKAMSANQSVAWAAGDVFRFSNHTKIYQVVYDASSNASGTGTITIFPPLRTSTVTDTHLLHSNPEFTMTLEDEMGVKLTAPNTSSMATLSFREVL